MIDTRHGVTRSAVGHSRDLICGVLFLDEES
jgi:hypothetical protein